MMKVLIVASYNSGHFAPFILEQAAALQRAGCELEFFGITGKGMIGYLRNLPALKQKIRDFHPNLIHAHYGLSGLFATLQNIVPVVITFHGSDINDKRIRLFSWLAAQRASWNIFVCNSIRLSNKSNSFVLPCGIDLPPTEVQLGLRNWTETILQSGYKHVLFAGAFDNSVKNASLAKQVVASIPNVQLVELKGFTREQVYALMYVCDVLLLTSHSEGSPQVIKEAMACGLPIVATYVGDIKERIHDLPGCYGSVCLGSSPLVNLLQQALSFNGRTDGRQRIIEQGLTNDLVAEKLLTIYNQVLNNERTN